jgi:endonuclease/exonuclease/phosphatase family metal-dependent hydrolase
VSRVTGHRHAPVSVPPLPPLPRLGPVTPGLASDPATLRVATYNIHKGVRGIGPAKRLEIHNLGQGVAALQADLVFLQEVSLFHAQEARDFARTSFGWPEQGQAEFLAPEGYEVAYRTNAITRHGEHGNALLSRWPMGEVGHHDVSDHRFEQRGFLHVPVQWQGHTLHTVVVHLGLIHASRLRQVQRLAEFMALHVPATEPVIVAGDFNDWGERLDGPMAALGLQRACVPAGAASPRGANVAGHPSTFPSLAPVFGLDRVYTRGFSCLGIQVPRGVAWARMSDHLPLLVELALA